MKKYLFLILIILFIGCGDRQIVSSEHIVFSKWKYIPNPRGGSYIGRTNYMFEVGIYTEDGRDCDTENVRVRKDIFYSYSVGDKLKIKERGRQ